MPELVDWFELAALVLIGLIPFAVLGVLLGHVLTVDSIGPALGGTVTLFALLGGAWGPVANTSGVLKDLCQLLPSYWLVQAGQVALGGKRVAARGVDRDRGVDLRTGPRHRPRLQPRHQTNLIEPALTLRTSVATTRVAWPRRCWVGGSRRARR